MAREQLPDCLFYSVGCVNREHCDYITLELDVNQGHKLYFLVDSGADISLIKNYKLLGAAEFEPKDRVRVEGFVIETHGSIEIRIREGRIDIPFHFQLVSKQVDLRGDGILGHDFFKLMQTRICYKE
jgi:ssDNA-binding Zn-finger/Zn-ribbon topoisomerase 1